MKKYLSILIAGLALAACETPNQRVTIRSVTNPVDDTPESGMDVASELARIEAENRAMDAEQKLAQEKEAAERAIRDVQTRSEDEMRQIEERYVEEQRRIAEDMQRQQQAEQPQHEPAQQPHPAAPVDVTETAYGAVCSYKIGNPYLIEGVSYYPHEDYTYSEIGIASWYGPNFHGGNTANGEVFDESRYTAAHRTLPMPSLVRVTNLENGVALNVKVNDRGPFARDRILDLSSAAADVLGIKEKGSARVKVEILEAESRSMKELAVACQNTDAFNPSISFAAAQRQPTTIYQENVPASAGAEAAPVGGEGDYFVQVAAYSSYDKAEELKNKISDIATVKIFKAKQGEGVLYKVRLGEFATKSEADRARQAVDRIGISGSRVIKKAEGSFDWNP
ncbi:MAG: septal ring lytic transglycosylase RlpA family protein [Rickettsiales bacterium]|jgi:rare lipoprotein A|nr:septal ring lytic transglycosylase RlpA family protein [Rickettsiales bacterium]